MDKAIGDSFGTYGFHNFAKSSAQAYYRIQVPLKALHKLGLSQIYIDGGKDDREEATQMMYGSDIMLAWHLQGQVGTGIINEIGDMKSRVVDGILRIPPAFVFDMDDAIEYVHPLNESFSHFGIRNFAGEFLTPGDSLTWPAPDGTMRPLWVDKQTCGQNDEVFDIERNFAMIGRHFDMARAARGVSVTTENLAKIYREQGCKNVYVFPNSVLESDHFFPNLAPHEGIRLVWEGSTSHLESWLPVAKALIEVLKENPHIKLVTFGAQFTWMVKHIKPEQLEHHNWLDYSAYQITRACLDGDINLAPLVDSPFNQCKSAIRFYEASIGPRPEVTLAANIGPYKEIEDGQTGLLYDTPEDFATKLRALIKSKELRLTLAGRARDWVRTNRSAEKTVIDLFEFYESLKREQRREALATR